MIKLNASLSKKVPIAGMDYSSQNFMAGLEVEIPDSSDPVQVKERIREVYQLLEESINEQIASHQQTGNQSNYPNNSSRKADYRSNNRYPRNNSKNNCPASQAQLKAIDAIAADRGLNGDKLSDMLQDNFRKLSISELSLREASKFITILKEIRNAS